MMRYDDDNYLDQEDDNDLWDDELELSSEEAPSGRDYVSNQGFGTHDSFDQYPSDYSEDDHDDGYYDETDQVESSLYPLDREKDKSSASDDYYSDNYPESKPETKQKREPFFSKKTKEDEDEDNDFFDSDDEPAPVKRPRTLRLDPEDPDYWIEEESPLEGLISKTRNKWKWWLVSALTLLGMLLFSWIWFLCPYADNAVKYGYIINMERRGALIKTFEGTMVPYKELGDPNPLFFEKVSFSVESDSLAAVMKRMMLRCVPARVEYKMYRAPLPWKGEEKMIIIRADSADPRNILPPEYRQ